MHHSKTDVKAFLSIMIEGRIAAAKTVVQYEGQIS